MLEYLYSNMKSIDVQREYMNMAKVGITHYVVDYEPTPAVPMLLKLVNIKCYYRIKIFPCQNTKDFDMGDFESKVKYAKRLGFNGIAIDAEAYSGSTIWTRAGAKVFGQSLSDIIGKYFTKAAVFPENLGGDKYGHYDSFLKGLFGNKEIDTFDLLMERTYNQGEWYNILNFYWKEVYKWRKYPNVRVFPGVWPEAVSDWERQQQMRITELVGKRFYYSETTNYEEGR